MACGHGGRAHIYKYSPAASIHPLPPSFNIPQDSAQAHLHANTAETVRAGFLSLPTAKNFFIEVEDCYRPLSWVPSPASAARQVNS